MRQIAVRFSSTLAAAGIALLAVQFSCGRFHVRHPHPLPNGEDAFNLVVGGAIKDGRLDNVTFGRIPKSGFSREPIPRKDESGAPVAEPVQKVHPVLNRWLAERPSTNVVRVMIHLVDDLRVPRFPEPAMDQPKDSRTNQAALLRASQIVERLKQDR